MISRAIRAQHILVINADGADAYAWHRGGLAHEGHFALGQHGDNEVFRQWLGARAGRFVLLVDIAEERFTLDHLPYAGLRDTATMVRRRSGQHFPDSRFTVALPLGVQAATPHRRSMLFGALQTPLVVEPWIQALTAAGATVRAIATPALLLDQWQQAQAQGTQTRMVVNFTDSGMRQTVFVAGRVRFTRLTPARNAQLAARIEAWASEIAETYAYVLSQRWIEHDRPLQLSILARPGDQASLAHLGDHCDGAELHFINLAPPGPPLTNAPVETPSDARAFLIEQAIGHPPPINYLPPDLRRADVQYRLRRALSWSMGVAAMGLFLMAGSEWFDMTRLQREHNQLVSAKARAEVELERLTDASAPSAPTSTAIEAWLRRLAAAEARSIPPAFVFDKVAQIMDTIPPLRLERLRWTSPPQAEVSSQESAVPPTPPVIAIEIEASIDTMDTSAQALQRAMNDARRLQPGLEIERLPPPSLNHAHATSPAGRPRQWLTLLLTTRSAPSMEPSE